MENYADRIEAANEHIDAYVISNEDWHEADDKKKIRLMNSADRTLHNTFEENNVSSAIKQLLSELIPDSVL